MYSVSLSRENYEALEMIARELNINFDDVVECLIKLSLQCPLTFMYAFESKTQIKDKTVKYIVLARIFNKLMRKYGTIEIEVEEKDNSKIVKVKGQKSLQANDNEK